jgi:peptidoglycan LD-endopeptidase LytH
LKSLNNKISVLKIYLFFLTVLSFLFLNLGVQENPCVQFNELYIQVRDGLISKQDAIVKINELIPEVNKYFSDKGGVDFTNEDWVFPLRGYGADAIGGKNGSGYIVTGYDFFDGNKHGGHPAHDIFIRDRNQDCIDDITGKPVDVLSMSEGVVVSAEKDWDVNSDLRGGKYIMIYNPFSNAIFYYAHNNVVNVSVGDIVKPGDKIAEVGRTGLNAYKKRSPTHLHISFFLVNEGDIKPDNIYRDLLSAKSIE